MEMKTLGNSIAKAACVVGLALAVAVGSAAPVLAVTTDTSTGAVVGEATHWTDAVAASTTMTVTLTKAATASVAPVYHVYQTVGGSSTLVKTVTLSRASTDADWKVVLSGLAATDADGNAVSYSATETVSEADGAATATVTLTKAGSSTDAAPVYHLTKTVSGATTKVGDVTLAWDAAAKCWKATEAGLATADGDGNAITYGATEDVTTTTTTSGSWSEKELVWVTEGDKAGEHDILMKQADSTHYKVTVHSPQHRYLMDDGTVFWYRSEADYYSINHNDMNYQIQDGSDVRTWIPGTTTTTTAEEAVGTGCCETTTVQPTKAVERAVSSDECAVTKVDQAAVPSTADAWEKGFVTYNGNEYLLVDTLSATDASKVVGSHAATSTWANRSTSSVVGDTGAACTHAERLAWLGSGGAVGGSVARLYGAGALDTMETIVTDGWSEVSSEGARTWETGGTVLLATSAGYWDALVASSAAGLTGAPVLVTDGRALSAQTSRLLGELRPARLVVCGGPAAVTDAVVASAASAAGGARTERLYGAGAVETADRIYEANADELRKGGVAVVATSKGYWDALSASTYAYVMHAPIFLTRDDGTLSDETAGLIERGGFKTVYVVGGTAAVGEAAASEIAGLGCAVTRLGGAGAEDTSRLFAAMEVASGLGSGGVAVATSGTWQDALTGAARAARGGQVLVVASGSAGGVSCVDATVAAAPGGDETVFGGPAAVPTDLYARVMEDVSMRG